MLEAHPEGVNHADHRGWIPLHVACSMGTELSIFDMLLEDYPETVLVKTHKGSDCVKCAKMSKGHPNEDAIVELMEELMAAELAKVERKGDSEDMDEEKEKDKDTEESGDDESHHADDGDLINFDQYDNSASGGCERKTDDGEGDLLGLDDNGSGDQTQNAQNVTASDDLLLDIDTNATTSSSDADMAPSEAVAEGMMPQQAPPPPPLIDESTPEQNINMESLPFGVAFSSGAPMLDGGEPDEGVDPYVISDIGSSDIVKALEGNLIDL